ncbi:hypothetical protein [Agrobacterium tumefaciens]|uniref:hypothetical protein n=1 Tax=Agrobacterium tumefaciens TaxID=358 RepID=UPI003B9F2D73
MNWLWLDFWIFGGGHGLGVPTFPQTFTWYDGTFYTWIGGFGAQLQSFEWRSPPAGTRRRIAGRDYVVFNVSRSWFRCRVAWALARFPTDINEANALLPTLKRELQEAYV